MSPLSPPPFGWPPFWRAGNPHLPLLGLLLGAEAVIEQLLLPLHQVAHALHHLLRLAGLLLLHLSRAGQTQIFEHILQLGQ